MDIHSAYDLGLSGLIEAVFFACLHDLLRERGSQALSWTWKASWLFIGKTLVTLSTF